MMMLYHFFFQILKFFTSESWGTPELLVATIVATIISSLLFQQKLHYHEEVLWLSFENRNHLGFDQE